MKQSQRLSISQIVGACAVVVGMLGNSAPAFAQSTKGKASKSASAKPAAAKKNAKTNKQPSAKTAKVNAKDSNSKTSKGQKAVVAKGKDAANPKHIKQAAAKTSGKGVAQLKQVNNPKQKDVLASSGVGSAAQTKLRKQIAELQAKEKGKGKNKKLTKAQQQQLSKLQAELKRVEKVDQARVARARAQQQKQQQQLVVQNTAKPQVPQAPAVQPRMQESTQAAADVTETTDVVAAAATAMPAVQSFENNAEPAVENGQEDLIALQIAKQEAQQATANTGVADANVSPQVSAAVTAPVTQAATTAPVTRSVELASAAARTAVMPVAVDQKESSKPVTVAMASTAPAAPTVQVAPANKTNNANIVRTSLPARGQFGRVPSLSGSESFAELGPELHSNVAFVMDQNTGEVLVNKNGHFVSPIASITKLMTAVIVLDANLPMDEMITITEEDIDRLKGSRSRLSVGTTLSRQDLLHLALMSSENRAAHALGRTYPGGLQAAIRAMNNRALMLGMRNTRYVEPTGLSSANQSSARDLALLVRAAYRYPLIRNYTTYPGATFPVLGKMTQYNNTNRLIHSVAWDIGLQKTGFISEAGRCVVMQSNVQGRNVVIVLLDSSGTAKRAEDAEAIRAWVTRGSPGSTPRRNGNVRIVASR